MPGAVGAWVSPEASIWTIWPIDGTPWSSIRKTMYQPGGATLALVGPLIVTAPEPTVIDRFMKRWSMSTLCVTEPMRTSETFWIRLASGVSTVNDWP